MAVIVDDVRSLRFWRAVVAEVLGTALLVFVGCGSTLTLSTRNRFGRARGSRPTVMQISLCFGLVVATMVWALGHVSGGHVNPAVTVGHLVARKISLTRALLYVGAQMLGSVVGAALLWAVTPDNRLGTLGSTLPAHAVNPQQAVGVELLITFVLVTTVFASSDEKRRDLGGSKPLAIGLAVAACHLFAVPYTGSSMNSARTFGPSAIMGVWKHHWVYWVGPLSGGILAALLYEHVFAVNASSDKLKGFLLTRQYSGQQFKAKPQRLCIVEEGDFDVVGLKDDGVWEEKKRQRPTSNNRFRQKKKKGVMEDADEEGAPFIDRESNV